MRTAGQFGTTITRMAGLTGLAMVAAGCASVNVGSDYDRRASFAGACTYEWVDPPADYAAGLPAINPFLERRVRGAVEDRLRQRGYVHADAGEAALRVTSFVLYDREDDEGRTGYGARGPRIGSVHVGIGIGLGRAFHRPYYPYRFGRGRFGGFRDPWLGYPSFGYPFFGSPFYDYPLFTFGGYPFLGFTGYPYFAYPFGYFSRYPYSGRRWPEGRAPGTLVVDVADGTDGELLWRGWAEGAFWRPPDAEDLPEYVDDLVSRIMEEFPPEGSGAGCAATGPRPARSAAGAP